MELAEGLLRTGAAVPLNTQQSHLISTLCQALMFTGAGQ